MCAVAYDVGVARLHLGEQRRFVAVVGADGQVAWVCGQLVPEALYAQMAAVAVAECGVGKVEPYFLDAHHHAAAIKRLW